MNGLAGDKRVTFGELTLVLRPDFRAIAEIERTSGRGLLHFIRENASQPRIGELSHALAALAQSGGHEKFGELEAFEVVRRHGVLSVSLAVVDCLSFCIAEANKAANEKRTEEKKTEGATPVES